jgi:peptide/nickel transport system substrate-binding protein
MKNLRWQILIVILALVAIAILLLGQQPALQPVVTEFQPTSGGIYTEGLIGSFGRLNPILDYYNPADRDINRLLYSSLVRFDERGLTQLDLVESYGISHDGRIYNLSLNQEAVWHDGKPITGQDVVFTVELLRDESVPIPADVRNLWNQVEVVALDQHTVQFRLLEPFAPFIDYLTFGILPEHLLGQLITPQILEADFNLEPVGSGPYRFERLLVEEDEIAGVVLIANPDYYGEAPFIEQVVFLYYSDSQAALAAYRAGEIQGISQISDETLASALQEIELSLYTARLPQLSMILFNLDNPEISFIQEASIRRALLLGLNRQWMIDNLLDGQAILADGPVFPESWAYFDGIERVPYDPEAALSLIKETGYTIPAEGGDVRAKEEQFLSFTMLHPDTPEHGRLAAAIAADWRRLGVEVIPEPITYRQLVSDHLDTRVYQAALVDLNLARYPDPDPYPFWHQTQITGGQNYSKWDDRQASEYLEQARVVVDLAERTRLYRNFQVRFNQELPALPLFYPVYNYAVDKEVQGVRMGPLFDSSDRLTTLPSWFLIARRTVVETGDEGE